MMEILWTLSVIVAVCTAAPAPLTAPKRDGTNNIDLLMPGGQPKANDTYLCYPLRLDGETHVIGFVPHAKMDTAHHMLLYGCKTPGRTEGIWQCGEMLSGDDTLNSEPVCKDGQSIVYAWAMDAPALHLPKDVGFALGGKNQIQWLVLQVHYKDVRKFNPPNHDKDHSGLTLVTTDQPLGKRAGIYISSTGGVIPAETTVYMETACSYDEPITLHPFAFRTHAHSHGEVISGYRIRDNRWTEIGRRSPKDPEMFYNITHTGMTVKQGDVLAARCTMVNKENRDVYIGNTQRDEMCNFYMMYYVDGDKLPHADSCWSGGPPNYSWGMSDLMSEMMGAVPDTASLVPGHIRPIQQSGIIDQVEEAIFNRNQELEELEEETERMKEREREMVSDSIMSYLENLSEMTDEE